MKKLLSIAFILPVMIFVASAADAQNRNNGSDDHANGHRPEPGRLEANRFPNRGNGFRIYTETKIVRIGRRVFQDTYQIRIAKNGRKISKRISRIEIKNQRGQNRFDQQVVKTHYKTETIREGRNKYRVTYKITEFRNGRKDSVIISKVRI